MINPFLYRPWFSRVVSSMPKDVVFVIDRSHFMKLSPGGYAMAKRAVNITINSLAPYDKVKYIHYSVYYIYIFINNYLALGRLTSHRCEFNCMTKVRYTISKIIKNYHYE